jgi:hypothetical protein
MRDSGRLRFEKGGVLAPIETRIGFDRQKSGDFGVVPKTETFRVFLLWETDSDLSSGVNRMRVTPLGASSSFRQFGKFAPHQPYDRRCGGGRASAAHVATLTL